MADRADFAPELGALKSLRPFVFWAQTTLPTVFDDSLSYYEVLTKLTKMVNTMLENEDTNAENIAALAEAYQELEDFTNNYFENLDVTQEINDKLDELVADGTIGGYVVERATTLFNDYLYGEDGESGKNKEINDMISEAQTDIEEALANFATRSNQAVTTFELNSAASIQTFEDRVDDELAGVSTIVEDWMDANFTNPSSVVIDDTLTVKDAAAEAYATGKLMDDATNMVLATSYWQDYVVDSVSGSFILADVSGGSNPAVGTGAPSMALYVANVTPGETYIVSGVASSYSTTRYIPAYALGNLTYDASDNPYYEFYDVYPRGWDESQDPGTVYQYVRNQTVRIPTGTTPTVTHLFIVGDSRVPITVRCSRLNARTDTALTSETLPAQGKATGDALETKLPWPVSGGNKDLGTPGYGLVTNADGTTSWQEVGGDYDEEIENLQNDVVDLKSAIAESLPMIEPVNLFDKNSPLIVDGKQLSFSSVATLDGSSYTHPIPIIVGETYSFQFSGSYYGDNANKIVRYCKADGTLGAGQNADVVVAGSVKYGRFIAKNVDGYEYVCVNVRTTLKSTFMFVKGSEIPTTYYPYFEPHRQIGETVELSDAQKEYIENAIKDSSLIPPHNTVNGKYVYWHNGFIDSNNSFKYIDTYVFPRSTLKYKFTNQNPNIVGLVFLDKDGGYISGVQAIATEQTITVPDYAYICRASVTDVSQIEYYYKPLPSQTSFLYDKLPSNNYSVLEAFTNISCFGDSLTYGVVYTGSSTSRRAKSPYPETLGKITGATITNVSEGGISASGWWTSYNEQITAKSNQLVIIYLGTNGGLTDTLSTDCPENTEYTTWANTNTGSYAKIVAKAQEAGAKVMLIKLYEPNSANDVIEQIATRFGCGVIENYKLSNTAYHLYPNLSGSNSIHYNDLGYSAFAHYVIEQTANMNPNYLKYLIPSA